MGQSQASVCLRQLLRLGQILCFRRLFQIVKDSLGAGKGILQLCDDTGNLIKRLCILIGIA